MNRYLLHCSLLAIFLLCAVHVRAQKHVVIPEKLKNDNYFGKPDSKYAPEFKRESANFAIFWDKFYGADPENNTDIKRRVNIGHMLSECERYFQYYVDTLSLIKKGRSASDKYKVLIFVTAGMNNTAYGGGHDSVGVLWTPSSRVEKEPYGVLAHELGHVFQYLASVDNGGNSFFGPISEMGAQYVLWQVLPGWLTFENFHLKAFLKGTQLAFLHPENAYHSPFVIEYWASLHGVDIYGRLLREVKRGEDIVATYKRVTNTSQEKFNDEIFNASRHFITWDLKRIQDIGRPYRNQHSTALDSTKDQWYKPRATLVPQDYGYNAIELAVPRQLRKIKLTFRADQAPGKGWRYGFIAYNMDGSRSYSSIRKATYGQLKFAVPANTQKLWLVVSGAPATHIPINRKQKQYTEYPYQFKIAGTHPLMGNN